MVLPSPAGVGEIAVTKISFPSLFFFIFSINDKEILALSSPNLIKSSSAMSRVAATLLIEILFAPGLVVVPMFFKRIKFILLSSFFLSFFK